jgi:hypothetical protein
MTALAAERDTPRMGAGAIPPKLSVPLAASTKLWRGSLVAVNRSGYAVAASASLLLTVVGVCAAATVDNTSGAAGDLRADVERGGFQLANSAGDDAITAADVGQPCFVVDDQTVARTSANGTRPFAGRVALVDSDGVWVEVGAHCDPVAIDLLLEATEDLTAAQFLFVTMDSSGDVELANAAGEDCVGVLQNAPADGAIAIVRVYGPSRVIASGVVAVGALVATTNAGKSKTAVAATTNTSDAGAASDALVASFVMGRALTVGAADAQHSIFVAPMGAIPTTAA